ncbi:MAG: hotdog fold thioesterase [Gemmatimonadales bacterium]
MNEDAQALAERVVASMMARDAFSRWLGIEVVHVAPRRVTVRMIVRDDMVNGFGVCHGGIAYALADSALAFASNTHGGVTVSIENGITYPKRIGVHDVLTATAQEESATTRLGFFRVTVRRGDDVVGLFHGTVYDTGKAFIFEEPASGRS